MIKAMYTETDGIFNNNNNNNLFLTHNNTIKVLKCGVQTIKYTQKKQNIQKMKSNDNINFLH